MPTPATPRPTVAIIGAGPAGLMAAETAARAGADTSIYERMPSPGRKLLMAGRGGLNLTHSESLPRLLSRYGAAQAMLTPAVQAWTPDQMVAWAAGLGQPTFVGSSGRVFPVAMKASPLLRAWLRRLDALGVRLHTRWACTGWDKAESDNPESEDTESGRAGALRFATPDGVRRVVADATVLALGGASWPRLGSDGGWTAWLADLRVVPLRPANCGFLVSWSEVFRARFEGTPLKRIALGFGGDWVRGEAVITAAGLEGGAVYALSARLREALAHAGPVDLLIDLRPDIALPALSDSLDRPRGSTALSNFLRKAGGLSPVGIGLVQEALHAGAAAPSLAALVKAVPIRLTAAAPLARAISTAGGLALDELDAGFMLRRRPGVFAAGEMLDWEAPTGGYLLQACFATGAAAGAGAAHWAQAAHGHA